MKIILAGLAFAVLVAAPAIAQPQRNEGSPASAIHLKQKKQLGVDYRDLYLSARKSISPRRTQARRKTGCAEQHMISVPASTAITADAKDLGARCGNRPGRGDYRSAAGKAFR